MQDHVHEAMKIFTCGRVFFAIAAALALPSCEELAEQRFGGFLPGGSTAGGYWHGDDVSGRLPLSLARTCIAVSRAAGNTRQGP